MKTYVLDASIVLEWLENNDKESARKLYQYLRQGKIAVYAPTFLLIEVGNILLKKKKFTQSDVEEFITALFQSGINFVDFYSHTIGQLLTTASKYKITTYDALYILLSQELKYPLITGDEELLKIKDVSVSLQQFLKNMQE